MRLTSRLATSIALLALRAAMFRLVHAREAFRIASVRPPNPDSPRARERETQLIVQFREQAGERDVARVAREAGAARVALSGLGEPHRVGPDAGSTTAAALRRPAWDPEVAA